IARIVLRETGVAISLWLIVAAMAVSIWTAAVMPLATEMPSILLLPAALFLGWSLLALGAVDVLALRLPDILTYPLAAVGLLLSWGLPDHNPLAHLVGAVAGLFVFWLI